MSIGFCHNCQQPFNYNPLCDSSVTHKCFGASSTVTNEDYPDVTKAGWNRQGNTNKLWGTRAAAEGAKSYNLTERGNRSDTTSARQFVNFIEIKDGNMKDSRGQGGLNEI